MVHLQLCFWHYLLASMMMGQIFVAFSEYLKFMHQKASSNLSEEPDWKIHKYSYCAFHIQHMWLKAIFGMHDHGNHQFTQKPIFCLGSQNWGGVIWLDAAAEIRWKIAAHWSSKGFWRSILIFSYTFMFLPMCVLLTITGH